MNMNIVIEKNGAVSFVSNITTATIKEVENKFINVCKIIDPELKFDDLEDILDEGFYETKINGEEIVISYTDNWDYNELIDILKDN